MWSGRPPCAAESGPSERSIGLTLHEIWTYRATHGLNVRTFEAPELAHTDGIRSAGASRPPAW
ncbi:MAG TPA: hypothetical protein VE776_11470 [Actinomycetota bacterium]|jgi:hypothetical protein|nr:hypothetical protein [Actinomycetota bacterium]